MTFCCSDMFGDDCVNVKDGNNLSVTVDGVMATIDPETRVSTTSGRSQFPSKGMVIKHG